MQRNLSVYFRAGAWYALVALGCLEGIRVHPKCREAKFSAGKASRQTSFKCSACGIGNIPHSTCDGSTKRGFSDTRLELAARIQKRIVRQSLLWACGYKAGRMFGAPPCAHDGKRAPDFLVRETYISCPRKPVQSSLLFLQSPASMTFKFKAGLLVSAALLSRATLAASSAPPDPPVVQIDDATYVGIKDSIATDAYLGIRFADAPRFGLPVPISPPPGRHDAGWFGFSCPQQNATKHLDWPFNQSLPQPSSDPIVTSEDCLNLNIWVPTGTDPTAHLPVAVWIFGGAFEVGSAQSLNGSVIVTRSIEMEEPVIYVSMNYRVSAYGFLPGQEVKDAGIGNIGLEDQREALRWINKYIAAFGGDPSRVTIWGESAGGISVALQLLTNNGDREGLFRGAFMQSGGPIPVGDVSHGQPEYDGLVQRTGCESATDTLECLKNVPYDILKDAVDDSPSPGGYTSLKLAYLPRVDGRFLVDTPHNLVVQGSVASVPFVTGNCDDEGTFFSIFNLGNALWDSMFRDYILDNYLPRATASDVGDLFDVQYPDDPTAGSPFNTGTNFTFFQYKRLAALQGDLVFQAPRRFFLNHTSYKQPTWSFLSRRNKNVSYFGEPAGFFGAGHGTDMLQNVYAPGDMTDYLVHFVNHLDPNGSEDHLSQWPQYDSQQRLGSQQGVQGQLIEWPQYDIESRKQLVFQDGDVPLVIEPDSYRAEPFAKLTDLSMKFPL